MRSKIFSLLMTAFLVLNYCGSKDAAKPEKSMQAQNLPKVQVLESMGAKPSWTEMGDGIGEKDGKKVIYFTGYGESTNKETAKESAQLNAATTAAQATRATATKQVAKAWESIGAGDGEQKEQVMKGLEAIFAKNVDVSGLLKEGIWWRQVIKPIYQNGKFTGNFTKPVFEYYVRYAIDYRVYTANRDKVIKQTVNNTDKTKITQITTELKKEDTAKPIDFSGYWVGVQTQPSGKGSALEFYYELTLTQKGTKVTGKSYTSGGKSKDEPYFVIFSLEGEVIDGKLVYEEKTILKDNARQGRKWYFTGAEMNLANDQLSGPWWSATAGTGQIRKHSETQDDGQDLLKKVTEPDKLK